MKEKVKFRWPIFYRVLYSMVSVAHKLYYRRFTVVGYEKIPFGSPVIFAPNHQNALMDALAVDFAAKRSVVFLARADIFKKPFVAKILNMLRILPIYRIRDGIESLGNNQEVFDTTVATLKSNYPICILPEGNHEGQKRLRSLKKGIFRIALQAEEGNQFNLNLHIVPVGLDYSDYFNAGADLTVVFGTPIRIADYAEQYHENEQKTINKLMNVLSENMRSVMIHIPEEHYELIHEVSEMYEPNVWNTCNIKRHPYNRLTIRQYIVHKATEAFKQSPEKATQITDALRSYNNLLGKLRFDDCLLQQRPAGFLSLLSQVILSILLLPIQLYGFLLNYIPFKLPIQLALKVKDKHFKSSVQFVISLLFFPVYYLILITLFSIFSDGVLRLLLFIITLPLSGIFSFYNYQNMELLWEKIRLYRFKHVKSEQYKSLINERIKIIDLIKATLNS
jgi:1-acyl-sn-glycerol-3-phosphate acyltransferase